MINQLREKISERVLENESLVPHTTYLIGGPAKYYFEAKTEEEALQAVNTAKELGIDYYVLGAGSNVLVSDEGYNGLIIRVNVYGVEIEGEKVRIGAGTSTAYVALKTAEAGLSGFEWGVGLPGTIGGAVRGNAGCFGGDVGESVESVRFIYENEIVEYNRAQCQFDYRNSWFKNNPGVLITSVQLNLKSGGNPTELKEKLKDILDKKRLSQPIFSPTSGCIFKNWKPANEQELNDLRSWLDINPDMTVPLAENGTVPAGWIIDRAQLKGTKVGHVQISDKHANFFINDGSGTAYDVIGLIGVVKTRIRNMTKSRVNLQEEIEYIGF